MPENQLTPSLLSALAGLLVFLAVLCFAYPNRFKVLRHRLGVGTRCCLREGDSQGHWVQANAHAVDG